MTLVKKPAPDHSRARETAEPAAVWVDRRTLKPWDRNPRQNAKAVAKVAASIKRFGFGAPIVARKADSEVIAGHTRLLAAESLGLDKVPVRFVDLDPAEAHLLALADNKIGEVAEWDAALLGEVLSQYGLEDAELAGWDESELEKMGGEQPNFAPGNEDEQGELDSIKPIVCPNCKHEFTR